VNKLVPCAWLLSGALEVWDLRLQSAYDYAWQYEKGNAFCSFKVGDERMKGVRYKYFPDVVAYL